MSPPSRRRAATWSSPWVASGASSPAVVSSIELPVLGRQLVRECTGSTSTSSTSAPADAVFARATGHVARLLVKPGQHVMAGQPLARLDDDGASEAAVQQAQLDLADDSHRARPEAPQRSAEGHPADRRRDRGGARRHRLGPRRPGPGDRAHARGRRRRRAGGRAARQGGSPGAARRDSCRAQPGAAACRGARGGRAEAARPRAHTGHAHRHQRRAGRGQEGGVRPRPPAEARPRRRCPRTSPPPSTP